MKEKMIKVLKVSPMQAPEPITLKNQLRSLQEAVSIGADYTGLIEIIALDDETCILCNEEGKLLGLEPNRYFGMDILCGVFYVVGQDKARNLCSLSPAVMERYMQVFAVPDVIAAEEVRETLTPRIWFTEGV